MRTLFLRDEIGREFYLRKKSEADIVERRRRERNFFAREVIDQGECRRRERKILERDVTDPGERRRRERKIFGKTWKTETPK